MARLAAKGSLRSPTKSPEKPQRVVPETPQTSRRQPPQTPRRLDRPDSLLLSLKLLKLESDDDSVAANPTKPNRAPSPHKTPKRASKKAVQYDTSDDDTRTRDWTEDESINSLSDFVVPDSASDDELCRPPRSMRKEGATTMRPGQKEGLRSPRRLFRKKDLIRRDSDDRSDEAESVVEDSLDLTDRQPAREKTPRAGPLQTKSINLQPWPVLDPFESPLEKSEPSSPTKASRKPNGEVRFVTPPTSPSKPKLRSPTKSAARIPPSPHRPSVDAFWSQDVINSWNDEYSPRKTPTARRIVSSNDEDDGYASPTEARRSPTKSPAKTPKKDKALIEQRKRFDAEKHELAASFLKELDDAVADGQLATLTASTGGVRIVWSTKLLSTAGRANWKRETIRPRPSSSPSKCGSCSSNGAPASASAGPTVRHHAHVELATKVITDAGRLRNVLAHEFCHLAAFMLSDAGRDAPHGRAFRQWAARVTAAFAHRDVAVTTRHAYDIAYAYAWRCAGCGGEVQRHSRSVDPARQRCGTCRGPLVQVRPAPRTPRKGQAGGAGEGGGGSRYQAFVKRWYKEVKSENDGWSMGQIMAELARRYRAEKEEEKWGGKGEDADEEDRAVVREKKESLEGSEVAEIEEVTVLESDEEGPVENEEPDALEQGLKALSLEGAKV